MIKYSLKCNEVNCRDKEPFDGWFQNSNSYNKQINAGFVSCPYCGSLNIEKSLMSPSLKSIKENKSKNSLNNIEQKQFSQKTKKMVDMTIILRNLKKEIRKNAEFVGKNFAKEATAIHEGRSKERSIYGQASSKDLEDLKSKNIDVVTVPWVHDDN